MSFNIEDYVTFDSKGRAICPSCQQLKGSSFRKRNLSLMGSGAYKCFAGCSPKDIRDALGAAKPSIIPTAIAQQTIAPKSVTVSPEKVGAAHQQLIDSNGPAKQWLRDRGINDELMKRHRLGITRAKCGDRHIYAITIPLPNADGTAYYQKKRLAPWLKDEERPPEYKPWSQAGIPVRHFFTYKPLAPEQTWLCEGEWDAIVLGQLCREAAANVAVATFTCGAGVVPPQEQLDELPGEVVTFYDRNDKPLPNGDRPGEAGARKIVSALGSRGRVGMVPMPDGCDVAGWDVTNAIQHGYQFADFVAAAAAAGQLDGDQANTDENPLKARLIWNDDLIDSAPDYTEWLVPDLLTANELFLVAAGPRAGKSLLAMTLALSVACGSKFLERPVIQGTVLYVCLEDSPAKLKEREQAQGWTRGLPVVWLKKFKLSELPHLAEIARELDPRLIVIDTLSRAKDSSVSESSAEMSQVLEPLQEMAEELETCILLVHHTGKVSVESAGNIDIFDTIRGSSAIRAVCRGSMVIASAERDYRLVVENGWGKHDLRVVLDANTQTWRLLGRWSPVENTSQKDQIIDCLKKLQVATIDQIHEETGIPRKSLYEQLSRLQLSDSAEEKIVKEGSRRKYTYRLPLFNTIQQLNSVLNSANPDSDDDTGYIQQNTFFSERGDHRESDHQNVRGCYKTHSNPVTEGDSDAMITFDDHPLPPATSNSVEYTPSNPVTEGDSPIQQLFNTPSEETPSKSSRKRNTRYSTRYSTPTPQSDQSGTAQLSQPSFEKGQQIEVYIDGEWFSGIYQWSTRKSRISNRTSKLAEGHRVDVNGQSLTISEHDLRHCGGESDG